MKRHQTLELVDKQPFSVMGIVNVTPDSFYDGNRHNSSDLAFLHAMRLVKQGADILDIGGESTRPGALTVSVDEECSRVVPVIKKIRSESDAIISIDTTKSKIAHEAILVGANWVNDISAGRFDSKMASICGQAQCPVILMHSRKRPETMQDSPGYGVVVEEVIKELKSAVSHFLSCGVSKKNIILDPGIGFAKRFDDNVLLLRNMKKLVQIGFPVLLGTSRKSFIGQITGREPQGRLAGTLASLVSSFAQGIKIFRVHDVAETIDFLKVLSTIEPTHDKR